MEREGIVEIKGTKGAGWRGIHSWTCNVVVSWWIIQTHVGPNKKDVTWLWVSLDQYKMKPTHYLMEAQVQGRFSLMFNLILLRLNFEKLMTNVGIWNCIWWKTEMNGFLKIDV